MSHGDFKRQLIRLGYFIFKSGANTAHFDLVAEKILREFNTALELQNLGWNSKGFYAFANGVYWQGKFQNVNNYGIIYLEGVDQDEADEYNEKVDYYYSPAFSVMHRKNQDGDDPYENDRKFVYKKANITLNDWMLNMMTVFKEKAQIGIVFNLAACFRDLYLKSYDYFPLLGGFGEKDSGKSGFGKILQNFFFYQEEPLELNQATLVGLNRRLSRTTNTVTFLDEFTNKLDEKIMQALKGALAALVAINNVGVFLLYFVQEKFNLPGKEAAGLAGTLPLVLGVCVIFFGLIAGWLCDRVDRRLLTVSSGFIGALGIAVMVLGQTQPLMYVAAGFIGMAYAVFSVASWALSTDIIPKERSGEFLGLQNIAGAGAGAIGAYIGGAIADSSGYVLLMAMFGVMFLLSSIAAVFVRPNPK